MVNYYKEGSDLMEAMVEHFKARGIRPEDAIRIVAVAHAIYDVQSLALRPDLPPDTHEQLFGRWLALYIEHVCGKMADHVLQNNLHDKKNYETNLAARQEW